MKVLVLANFDVGLYKFRKELLQELLKQHEVLISLPDGDLVRNLEKLGCRFIDTPVDRRGINPVTDLKLLLRYIRLLRKEKPDLVLTYTIKPNIYGGMACRWCGTPYAANITGLGTAFQGQGLLKKLVTVLYRYALKNASRVFFENRDNCGTLTALKIVKPEQTCVLNGAGVNLEEYPLTAYPSDGQGIRFLFIGRVMKEKGVDELFAAAERLHHEKVNAQFDIVGPMEDDYSARVKELTARGIIRYHGYQQDVKPFIAQAHCFVLPSYHEGMANTNLECASMGRPLITSDIPGCREAVLDGQSGFLCRPQNADSLYEKLKEFILLPQEARIKMGATGRRHVETAFDKKSVVRKTMKEINC